MIAADLDDFERGKGLDLKTISYTGHLLITVTPGNFSRVLLFLRSHFGSCMIHVNVSQLESLEDIISLLDNGAATAFVQLQQFQGILEAKLLADIGRLVVSVDVSTFSRKPEDLVTEIQKDSNILPGRHSPGIHLHGGIEGSWKLSKTTWKSIPSGFLSRRYVTWSSFKNSEDQSAPAFGYTPIISAAAMTTRADLHPESIPLDKMFLRSLKTDREDGLFSTVVVDESGACLGLVYSNEESIRISLQRGVGVYWSRSRNQLWIKGETSGNTQELIRIDVDCDADALRFIVRQKGNGMWQFCNFAKMRQDSVISTPPLAGVLPKAYRSWRTR